MDKVKIHKSICNKCNTTYAEKNHDYGDSFGNARKEIPNYTLGRLYDKFSRYKTLALGAEQRVKDEAIEDTLLDLANYAIMELVEREAEKERKTELEKLMESTAIEIYGEKPTSKCGKAERKPFDWEAFERSEFAVHCKTEKEAINFCGFSHERGVDWCGGDSRLEGTEWEEYREETCYRKDCYGTVEFYINERIPIVEWSDYMQEPTTEKTSEVKEGKYEDMSNKELQLLICIGRGCHRCSLRKKGAKHNMSCAGYVAQYPKEARKKMIEFLEGEE